MTERLELEDTTMQAVVKMVDGNPGATIALAALMKAGPEVDPQSALPIFFAFDTLGIYGSDIFKLWAYRCKGDSRKTLMLLRAHQLGFVDSSTIKQWAADKSRHQVISNDEIDRLDGLVCGELDDFQKRATPA